MISLTAQIDIDLRPARRPVTAGANSPVSRADTGRRRATGRRGGYTLVFFVMIVFAFMALAAVVIDLGLARLTQRQMQSAVDAAALEGLRLRDDPRIALDPVARDEHRRQMASQLVACTFDDDLDLADDAQYLGAGPSVDLVGGFGPPELSASQQIVLPDPPVWEPRRADGTRGLELNLDNEPYGDIVAGQFVEGEPGTERLDYDRADFAEGLGDSALLVRLRRTNNFSGLDSAEGISSMGSPLPYLFGRAALISGPNPEQGYSPRYHGISVRAAAIADARRVLSVGFASPEDDLPGALPIVIRIEAWGTSPIAGQLPVGEPVSLQVDGDGGLWLLTATGDLVEVGYFVELEDQGLGAAVSLGDQPSPLTGLGAPDAYLVRLMATLPTGAPFGYVPVVTESGMIAGFGYADQIARDPDRPQSALVLTKRTEKVAPENASAVLSEPLPNNSLTELLQTHSIMQHPLLAPILAR